MSETKVEQGTRMMEEGRALRDEGIREMLAAGALITEIAEKAKISRQAIHDFKRKMRQAT